MLAKWDKLVKAAGIMAEWTCKRQFSHEGTEDTERFKDSNGHPACARWVSYGKQLRP
jgi:hypothetical protein